MGTGAYWAFTLTDGAIHMLVVPKGENAGTRLFKWVAILTGSGNTLSCSPIEYHRRCRSL